MKYHGLYCGPNWSDGKKQLSVAVGQEAVDELDQLCKEHDAAYATTTDPAELAKADKRFAKAAIALGWPKSVVAGIAVGAQYITRAIDITSPMTYDVVQLTDNYMRKQTKKSALRGNTPAPNKGAAPSNAANGTTIKAMPSAYMITSKTPKPQVKPSKDGGVILKHRGLVSGFIGSTTFTAKAFQVNPGLGSVFPWCSQLARSYDKYRFRKLKFEFRSVVPTTTAGVVMMTFDYDTLDALPTSKFEHSQTTPNVESNSFNSFELPVACDNVFRFIRQGSISNTDLKTYDFGQMVISSSYGVASLLGEVYVDYEVELQKPSHGVPINCNLTQSSPPSVSTCIGTNAVMTGAANPISLGSDGSSIIFTRPGEYSIAYKFTGSGLSGFTVPTLVAGYSAGAVVKAYYVSTINSTSTTMVGVISARVGAGDGLQFSSSVSGSSLSTTALCITEVEYAP